MSHESESDPDLQQSILNHTAVLGITSQIKSSHKIDVNLDSEVSQLIQGKINSLEITGEKVIAMKDIRFEELELSCGDLSLDLTKAMLGKIAFERPGNFQVQLVFTESDCDRLLNSEYVRILLQNLSLDLNQEEANFYLQSGKCRFRDDGSLSLRATVILNREQQTKTAQFEFGLQFHQAGWKIKFMGGKYLENCALDLDETLSILTKVRDLLYLRHFNNADLAVDITKIKLENQQLTIQALTQIKRLPDSLTQSIKSVSEEVNNL